MGNERFALQTCVEFEWYEDKEEGKYVRATGFGVEGPWMRTRPRAFGALMSRISQTAYFFGSLVPIEPSAPLDAGLRVDPQVAKVAEEVSEARDRNAVLWEVLARCVGYNELARDASSIGEKMYLRLACDEAEKVYVSLGGKIARKPLGTEVIVPTKPPFLVLSDIDIELMRKAVKEFDEKKALGDVKAVAEQVGVAPEDVLLVLMSEKSASKEECRLCHRAIVKDGSRWVHADGKTYRHDPKPLPDDEPPTCPICGKIAASTTCSGCGWKKPEEVAEEVIAGGHGLSPVESAERYASKVPREKLEALFIQTTKSLVKTREEVKKQAVFLVEQLRRARCGCFAKDCVRHGAYVAEDVERADRMLAETARPETTSPSAFSTRSSLRCLHAGGSRTVQWKLELDEVGSGKLIARIGGDAVDRERVCQKVASALDKGWPLVTYVVVPVAGQTLILTSSFEDITSDELAGVVRGAVGG